MTFHLSFKSNGDISYIQNCVASIMNADTGIINILVDAEEVKSHWSEFQKAFFEADLLNLNGFFVVGDLDERLKNKVLELYSKSIFSDQKEKIISKNEFNVSAIPERNRPSIDSEEKPESADTLRTILVWNGKNALEPQSQFSIEINSQIAVATVQHVQKIFNTDFNGSSFGINRLEPGEIATTLITLDQKIEKYYYENFPSKGIFTIDDNTNKKIGYGIIIR